MDYVLKDQRDDRTLDDGKRHLGDGKYRRKCRERSKEPGGARKRKRKLDGCDDVCEEIRNAAAAKTVA